MRIRDWEEFQQYKDDRPMHWIKVWSKLLNNMEWFALSGDEAKLLVNLWLLASEKNGELPPVEKIAFRLRMDKQKVVRGIDKLKYWLVRSEEEDCTNPYETVRNRTQDKIRIDKEEEEEQTQNTPSDKSDRASVDPPGFAEFWELYPRKIGKGAARAAWKKVKADGRNGEIVAAVKAQAGSEQWKRGFIPNPATWLNQERWNDTPYNPPTKYGLPVGDTNEDPFN